MIEHSKKLFPWQSIKSQGYSTIQKKKPSVLFYNSVCSCFQKQDHKKADIDPCLLKAPYFSSATKIALPVISLSSYLENV